MRSVCTLSKIDSRRDYDIPGSHFTTNKFTRSGMMRAHGYRNPRRFLVRSP